MSPDGTMSAVVAGRRGELASRQGATQPIRVLIVDDHLAFAEALEMAIDTYPDLACVGTPGTIEECLAAVEASCPDVVLIDVRLPDGDGIDAIAHIRAAHEGARVLVLTGYADVGIMARAASAGASGFIPKESPIRAVLEGVRATRNGTMLVDGSTLAAILSRVKPRRRTSARKAAIARRLTARELGVLALMREGLDSHAIAEQLAISLNTCRGHQKSILAKLEAHSQLEAVVVAARLGLIEPLDD
jgi:DNA-binding NarL/FixJ family response regulator